MTKNITYELEHIAGKEHVKEDEPLKNHTAIKMGGNAAWYVTVSTIPALKQVVAFAYNQSIPVAVLGSGTSFVAPDGGIQGIVIRNNCRAMQIVSEDKITGESLVSCESGALTGLFVRFCLDASLSGVEYAMGLPGTVGGAITMNAMYPKIEAFVSDTLDHAYILTKEGNEKKVDREYFQFGINKSILQTTHEILLTAVFKLHKADKTLIDQKGKEALMYRVSTQPKGHTTGYTYRNINDFNKTTPSGSFPHREMKNVWFFPENPRYILQNGKGRVEDLKDLKEYMNHFLQEQNIISEYTIRVTGGN